MTFWHGLIEPFRLIGQATTTINWHTCGQIIGCFILAILLIVLGFVIMATGNTILRRLT